MPQVGLRGLSWEGGAMTYDDTRFLFGCTLDTLSRIIGDCLKRKGRVLLCVGHAASS